MRPLLTLSLSVFFTPALCFAQAVNFINATAESGVDYVGPSFGASWGDANGDGWPDIWLSNHGEDPLFYLNNGDGSFMDASWSIDFDANTDMHGAAWADYDNDGDQDLLLMIGAVSGTGSGANQFFENHDSFFIEKAEQVGLDYSLGRGRTPMWFDWDQDGLLEVMLNNWGRSDGLAPTRLFAQSSTGFTDTFPISGISDDSENSYSRILMMGAQATPHILIPGPPFPAKIYDYQQNPAMDISSTSGLSAESWGARDTVIADFNGDLLADLLLIRNSNGSDIDQLNDRQARVRLAMLRGEIGVRVEGGGVLELTLNPAWQVSSSTIFIGANASNPSSTTVILDPLDETMHGAPEHLAGVDLGVYIGYSPETREWSFLMSSDSWMGLNIELTSVDSITNIEPIGFIESDGALQDQMFVQVDGAGFVNTTVAAGLGSSSPCSAGVAADFDNDMDVDIYLACRGPVSNRDNRLLVNDGAGSFTLATDAWGAAANVSGRGEAVASADYDRNGFVDLLVANGEGSAPFNLGPTLLFKNEGNNNHWLEIDLEGVDTNRDAIGTRVIVDSGGKLQLREQLGGMHQFTQDHVRLHFGLGENTQIDSVEIQWPKGIHQIIENLPVDQIIRVVEPTAAEIKGRPNYWPGVNEGLMIWKDYFDGPYHFRISGQGPYQLYEFSVIADAPFIQASAVDLHWSDKISLEANSVSIHGGVSSGEDGLDLYLPPEAEALISYVKNGDSNPRDLHVGNMTSRLSPVGWMGKLEDFGNIPFFQPGKSLGLYLGTQIGAPENLQLRWGADGDAHFGKSDLFYSLEPNYVNTVYFESEYGDVLEYGPQALLASGFVGTHIDGVDIGLPVGTTIGIVYEQDGLIQPYRVFASGLGDGVVPAYQLPRAEPYGIPEYDRAEDAGLFIWRSDSSNKWFVRVIGNVRFQGELVSDGVITNLRGISLESSDSLEQVDAGRIMFDLRVGSPWEDGIEFELSEDASLHLQPFVTNGIAPEKVYIGEKRWPVSELPLNLGRW